MSIFKRVTVRIDNNRKKTETLHKYYVKYMLKMFKINIFQGNKMWFFKYPFILDYFKFIPIAIVYFAKFTDSVFVVITFT